MRSMDWNNSTVKVDFPERNLVCNCSRDSLTCYSGMCYLVYDNDRDSQACSNGGHSLVCDNDIRCIVRSHWVGCPWWIDSSIPNFSGLSCWCESHVCLCLFPQTVPMLSSPLSKWRFGCFELGWTRSGASSRSAKRYLDLQNKGTTSIGPNGTSFEVRVRVYFRCLDWR